MTTKIKTIPNRNSINTYFVYKEAFCATRTIKNKTENPFSAVITREQIACGLQR
jgi:hypothetical protein